MKHLLLLIRHGESTWNVEHRLPGQLPGIELTGAGRAQAQRLAKALSMLPLSTVISSPLARAVETAEYQFLQLPIRYIVNENSKICRIISTGACDISQSSFIC